MGAYGALQRKLGSVFSEFQARIMSKQMASHICKALTAYSTIGQVVQFTGVGIASTTSGRHRLQAR
jgi:hypothetical protein